MIERDPVVKEEEMEIIYKKSPKVAVVLPLEDDGQASELWEAHDLQPFNSFWLLLPKSKIILGLSKRYRCCPI